METIQSYLEKYPSIKVVLDIHRDAFSTDEDGAMKKPCFVVSCIVFMPRLLRDFVIAAPTAHTFSLLSSVDIDIGEELSGELGFTIEKTDQPQVLIVHTHTGERLLRDFVIAAPTAHTFSLLSSVRG